MTYDALNRYPEMTAVMVCAGCMFGLFYFVALKRSVALFLSGGKVFGSVALTLGRVGAAAAFLFVIAKLGAAPLLAALFGFLIARALMLYVERKPG